jgi:hypothetical protein
MRALAFLLMVLCSQAQAAEIYAGSLGSVGLDGSIQVGDATRFASFTARYPAGTFISLGGPGGIIGEILAIGDIIQKRGFSTVITNRRDCNSACAILFFSGHHAVIQRNSAICFHTPYDKDTGRGINNDQANELADEIVKWGLTKRQALAILGAAPPNGIHCATELWASYLGFQYSIVFSFGTMWRSCSAKFCLAAP